MLLNYASHSDLITLAQYVRLMDLSVSNLTSITGLLPEVDSKGEKLEYWQRRLRAEYVQHIAFGTAWTNQPKDADELREAGYIVTPTNATWHYIAPPIEDEFMLQLAVVRVMVANGVDPDEAIATIAHAFFKPWLNERLTIAYNTPKPMTYLNAFKRGLAFDVPMKPRRMFVFSNGKPIAACANGQAAFGAFGTTDMLAKSCNPEQMALVITDYTRPIPTPPGHLSLRTGRPTTDPTVPLFEVMIWLVDCEDLDAHEIQAYLHALPDENPSDDSETYEKERRSVESANTKWQGIDDEPDDVDIDIDVYDPRPNA